MSKELNYYNVHGFVIAVDSYANWIFLREYQWFMTTKDKVKEVDLYVRVWNDKTILPTRRAGGLQGLRLPISINNNTLWYNVNMDAVTILAYCEALMWWQDKVFLHAGGISKEGKTFLFTGGGGVGKTSLVLNFIRRGYEYLGDDWILLGGNGMVYPLPKPVHIYDYNLKDEEIARNVLGNKRHYYKLLFKFFQWGERIAPNRYIRAILQRFRPRFSVPIHKIYSKAKISQPNLVSRIFLLGRRDVNGKYIEVNKDIMPQEVATRLAFVNLFERNYFFKEYYRYAYEFGVRNERVEEKFTHDLKIYLEAFQKAEIYRIIIPKGLDLTNLDLEYILQEDCEEGPYFFNSNV